jgi:hypothetical protein
MLYGCQSQATRMQNTSLSQAPQKRRSLPFLSGQAGMSMRRDSCMRELMQQEGKATGNQTSDAPNQALINRPTKQWLPA